ncbi:hypothetical protein ACLOJK_010724 [Asimina triloba]
MHARWAEECEAGEVAQDRCPSGEMSSYGGHAISEQLARLSGVEHHVDNGMGGGCGAPMKIGGKIVTWDIAPASLLCHKWGREPGGGEGGCVEEGRNHIPASPHTQAPATLGSNTKPVE